LRKLEVLLLKYEFQSALIFNMDKTMLDASGHISSSGGYVHPLAILSIKTLSQLNTQVQGFFSISSQLNGFIDNAI
jgi:hypothetical protein